MDTQYWQQRWDEGRIGWHLDQVNGLLLKHWPELPLDPGSRVFVPLCGKSLDMGWLAARGHRVRGVDVARQACADFFAERGDAPKVTHTGRYEVFEADRIALWAGDAFALTRHDLADCQAVYDRAALIALPPDMRRRYVDTVYGAMPPGSQGLLITLEYPPAEKQGPPFSVDEAEVHRLFEPAWRVSPQARLDILEREPGFRDEGVTRLHTCAYRLQKRLG